MDVVVPREEHPGAAIEAAADGVVTVGRVGMADPMPPVRDLTVGVGTSAAELTPRLPISVEPKGTPTLGLPPGVVAAVELGLDDAAMLLAPEPHMPDMPAVSSVPELVDIPALAVIPAVIEDVAAIPDDMSTDAAVFPDVLPTAGVDPAIAIPPPS